MIWNAKKFTRRHFKSSELLHWHWGKHACNGVIGGMGKLWTMQGDIDAGIAYDTAILASQGVSQMSFQTIQMSP